MDLFTSPTDPHSRQANPLADRMRPQTFDEVVGQDHLTGGNGILKKSVENQSFHSFVLWGPPGTGKTTLAQILAKTSDLPFYPFSAVLSGTKELKEIMQKATHAKTYTSKPFVVFVDEIHRFNKAQQDAFLPYVERKDIVLIGATTENPSFEIRSALLSRMQVYTLKTLTPEHILELLRRALLKDPWLLSKEVSIEEDALLLISQIHQGDARSSLSLLETCVSIATSNTLTKNDVLTVMEKPQLYYDKDGEEHYNIISALHKSMRNSDENASLYWLARMLEAGEDPKYIVRRMIRFASEDIGLAEPFALTLAISVKDAVDFLGMPECKLALSQLAVYLAAAPKSNAIYTAYKRVEKDIADGHVYPVPLAIRNAPTKLMKDLAYGKDYAYAHDHESKTTSLQCLPDELKNRIYFKATDQGRELDLKKRLKEWKSLREKIKD